MKKFGSAICFFLIFIFASSCERPDYTDEIKNAYKSANHGQVIAGNMWSAVSQDVLEWLEAVSYCNNLYELGYSDWRLPTVDELRTLIKDCPKTESGGSCGLTDKCITEEESVYNCFEPQSCNCQRFYQEDGISYSKLGDWEPLWSSIPNDCRNDEDAWYVDFRDGGIHQPTASANVACEHHSPPKTYVRCVRQVQDHSHL